MALDVLALLNKTGALLKGHFRLSSGLHSPNYVQCALLLQHPRNAGAVGEALAQRLRPMRPQKVVAPALGGLIIGYTTAQALDVPLVFVERKEGEMSLRRGFKIAQGERVVIVEDVVTTGKSTREAAAVVAVHGGLVFGYGSVLNRSGVPNPFDKTYEALLALELAAYDEAACPLCESGLTLDSPGSRFTQPAP